jgi:small nuclear ribonucleoprotein (snRNP)-like protein
MKNPTRKTTIIVVTLLSFLLSPLALAAQTAPTDWSRLNNLTDGTTLSVKLKDGKKVDGTFEGVSDTALSLTVKKARQEMRREDITSVHEVSGKSAATATLIGLGVGAGAGAAVGISGDASSDGFEKLDNSIAAGVTVLGAGIGALTGFLVGRSRKKRVLLYVSK